MNYEKADKWYRSLDAIGYVLVGIGVFLKVFFQKDYSYLITALLLILPCTKVYWERRHLGQNGGAGWNLTNALTLLFLGAFSISDLFHGHVTWINVSFTVFNVLSALSWGMSCIIGYTYIKETQR